MALDASSINCLTVNERFLKDKNNLYRVFCNGSLLHLCKARNNFESTRAEVERLMRRIRSAEEDFKAPSSFTMEGYLYIQEKREAHTQHINKSVRLSFCFIEPHTSCRHENAVLCLAGPLGSVWTRYYCTYEKSSKMFTMSSTESRAANRQVSRGTDSSPSSNI